MVFLKRRVLPIKDMIVLEDWLDEIKTSLGYTSLLEQALSKELGLKVEYVPDCDLPNDTEAELRPIDDERFFGLIRISNKYQGTVFSYMHEIMHYLKDVGIGNRVTTVFTRKIKGKTDSEHEQHINYATAAAIMPYQEIKDALKKYDVSRPRMDELKFIADLCAKYRQDRTAVIRRIQEVRRLYAYRTRGQT